MISPIAGRDGGSTLQWKARHSAWLLATFLGCGLLSCVGFIYCAARVRTRPWMVLAGVSTVATVVGWILVSAWTDSAGEASAAATTYVVGLWLASTVLGLVVNVDYLDWRSRATPTSPPV